VGDDKRMRDVERLDIMLDLTKVSGRLWFVPKKCSVTINSRRHDDVLWPNGHGCCFGLLDLLHTVAKLPPTMLVVFPFSCHPLLSGTILFRFMVT
jgi:hypothetical protein